MTVSHNNVSISAKPRRCSTIESVELYDTIGGTPGCKHLAEALYAGIKHDAVLRPLFPGKTLKCAIEEFSAFLVQFLGGPAEDSQRRRWLHLNESHHRFSIGTRERNAWLKHMTAAIDSMPLEEKVRVALREFFEHASTAIVNTGTPPPAQPLPRGDLARRWATQREVQRTIEAIRSRDPQRAIAAISAIHVSDSVRCGLLTEMLHAQSEPMTEYVHDAIRHSPELAHARYYSRTLLHNAAALGLAETVKVLLDAGADPNGGRHQPLYCLANEYHGEGSSRIVRMLVAAGADVNACDNVKRCTALHMAARRDHVETAEALLDCGADIEARDSNGATPLRRAINMHQKAVADLLRARGARL
jgi:hemoglobin